MSILAGEGGERVCGPAYSLLFPGGSDGGGFPTSWHYGTQATPAKELFLASADTDTCTDPVESGILVYPAGVIDGRSLADQPTAAIVTVSHATTTVIDTPFVVKKSIAWSAAIDSCAVTLSGTSQWTLFADGRVVRYDHFSRDQSTTSEAMNCRATCVSTPTPPWIISTYLTLPFTGNTDTTAPSAPDTENQINPARVCTNNPALGMNLGAIWSGTSGRRLGRPTTSSLSLLGDVEMDAGSLTGVSADMRTTYAMTLATACQTGRLDDYDHEFELTFSSSGNPGSHALAMDGLYGGDNGTGGGYPASSDVVDIGVASNDAAIPSTTGVYAWIHWDTPRAPAAFAFSGSAEVPEYAPIDGTLRDWIFHYKNTFAVGTTSTVTSVPM